MTNRSIRPVFSSLASLAALSALVGCSSADPAVFTAPDREIGARAPLTAPCDAMDPTRCMLPWPSSTFTAADPKSATGLRLAVDPSALVAPDDPWSVNLADGFSRVTPLVTAFAAPLSQISAAPGAKGPVRLVLAQPDHPDYGALVPLRIDVTLIEDYDRGLESLVTGYPLRPLEPNADYVAVVMDDLPVDSGGPKLTASRAALVALGRVAAASQAEADLAAYHAPTRAALERAGIDPAHVLRVWDFTTRSQADATARLSVMRASAESAVTEGKVNITIDTVTTPADPSIALIVEGRLGGLPSYVTDDPEQGLTLDDQRLPVVVGSREAPFRVLIPAGSGDYRFVMFGHGTGGSYHDPLFDQELGERGLGKVNTQFYGWTDTDVLETFVSFIKVFIGTHRTAASLMQAVADSAAVAKAMTGPLSDALAAPEIGGQPNPAAGRRPDFSIPVWVGGSLGGTMGLVIASSAKETYSGVLNVPGAAWTHFVPKATSFNIVRALLKTPYDGDLNALSAAAMSQGNWDDVDGAIWATELGDRPSVFLVQESIGDPVLPNPGSEMVAVTTSCVEVGAVLAPIDGVSPVDVAMNQSAITQYRVPETGDTEIHGFAARDTPAGAAAREQIQTFLDSLFAKSPKITVPSGCKGGSCDFSGP